MAVLGCRGREGGSFHQYLRVLSPAMTATRGVHSRLSSRRLAGNTWAARVTQSRTGTAERQAYTGTSRNVSLGIKLNCSIKIKEKN